MILDRRLYQVVLVLGLQAATLVACSGSTSSGNATGSGGAAATGGQSATGSSANSGGTPSAGGAKASGGVASTGGSTNSIESTGGSVASGGASSVGGVAATGGTVSSLGGTNATGGTSATGSSNSTGGATATGTLTLSWEFTTDTEGWIGGFADYPPADGSGYDLSFAWSSLPAEVSPGGGLLISGNNHSDDLFMYVTRQITGLAANTPYSLDVVVIIDTNAPTVCGGIGGAPGTSVYFKIGAVPFEPTASLDSQGWLRMNLDKGNQSVGGTDMQVVGDIGNTNTCPDATYQPKTLTLSGFSITSAADGTLWVILGTDSGFEGITTLYCDSIAVTLRPAN